METTFTLGESSEDVLENVCFMVLKIKKRRANTKIGATLLFFGLCTRHYISATVEAHFSDICLVPIPSSGHFILSLEEALMVCLFVFFLISLVQTSVATATLFYNLARTIIFT